MVSRDEFRRVLVNSARALEFDRAEHARMEMYRARRSPVRSTGCKPNRRIVTDAAGNAVYHATKGFR